MPVEAHVSVSDVVNQLYAQAANKDKEIADLLDKIENMTSDLTNAACSNKEKYDMILSVEYIFVRARILVENEAIKVKSILNSSETPPVLRAFFTKRDVLLSQVSSKLTLVRDDLQVLSKLQWASQNNYIK